MPKGNNNLSNEIRLWIAQEFSQVEDGFRTQDVTTGMSMSGADFPVDSGFVSSALNSWAKHNLIVSGFRLRKDTSRGRNAVWTLVSANGSATKKAQPEKSHTNSIPPGDPFSGEVIQRYPNGRMLVRTTNGLFKVEPFKL